MRTRVNQLTFVINNITVQIFELNTFFSICVLFFRGHTVRAVCESFHFSKDAGFKVVTHMMPDLPNVDYERDVLQFVVISTYTTME